MTAQTAIDDADENLSNQASTPPSGPPPALISSQLVGTTGSIAQASGSLSPLQNASSVEVASSTPDLFENNTALAQTQLTYQIEVSGPADTIVPLFVVADLNASGDLGGAPSTSSSFNASASLGIEGVDVSAIWSACGNSAAPSCLGDVSVNQSLGFHANSLYTVTETTLASAEEGGSASAFADPFFSIAADFAAEHPGFSIQVSPGVANARVDSGAPEPASWAMMILGLGGVGAALRRRRDGALLTLARRA
jgi:hypothetical protein